MLESKYKQEWLNGQHKTEYNDCRFSDDKIQYARAWMKVHAPDIDIDNPKNIVDRIANYKIYDTSEYKQDWSDKIKVYNELDKLGLSEIGIPYNFKYGKVSEADLNFNNRILKCNHGSGWNIVSNNKIEATKIINQYLDLNYAYVAGYEWQYENINPGIVIQPILESQPLDYQFYCEDGNVIAIDIQQKIAKSIIKHISFTGVDGKPLDYYIGAEPILKTIPILFMDTIKEMITIAELIAKDKKFVRVDLFSINNKIYFCEATFTPCSGVLDITNI